MLFAAHGDDGDRKRGEGNDQTRRQGLHRADSVGLSQNRLIRCCRIIMNRDIGPLRQILDLCFGHSAQGASRDDER